MRSALVILTVLAATLLAQPQLLAQADPPQADKPDEAPPELLLRVYDVAELTRTIPSFGQTVPKFNLKNALDCHPESGSDLFVVDVPVNGSRRLEDLIARMVRPDEPWEQMGGRSQIYFYEKNDLMFVETTEKAQREVSALLARLRVSRPTLRVDVQLVELDPAFVANAVAKGQFEFSTDDQKLALRQAIRRTVAQASLCCQSNQRVWHSAGVQVQYVSEIEPVWPEKAQVTINQGLAPPPDGNAKPATPVDGTATDDKKEKPAPADQVAKPIIVEPIGGRSVTGLTQQLAAAYFQRTSLLVDGLTADVMPTLTADGGAMVDYRLVFARILRIDPAPVPPGGTAPVTMLPRCFVDECRGTATVRLGVPLILASAVYIPAAETDPARRDGRPGEVGPGDGRPGNDRPGQAPPVEPRPATVQQHYILTVTAIPAPAVAPAAAPIAPATPATPAAK